ncbi:MAG: ribbon-helix-helix domain-containing protein [Candidatus Bathyarchaeia archaeon]
MTVIPLRLNDDEVRRLNLLMKQGRYRSRNEAIRAILAEGLEEKLGEDEDIADVVNKLLAIKKQGKNPISYASKRSVVEIVSEGRK